MGPPDRRPGQPVRTRVPSRCASARAAAHAQSMGAGLPTTAHAIGASASCRGQLWDGNGTMLGSSRSARSSCLASSFRGNRILARGLPPKVSAPPAALLRILRIEPAAIRLTVEHGLLVFSLSSETPAILSQPYERVFLRGQGRSEALSYGFRTDNLECDCPDPHFGFACPPPPLLL